MIEYQILIDIEVDVKQKQVELLTGFVKEILENSMFKDIITDVYWDEI